MPLSAVGLTTALGTAVESAYGTPVAPNRWYEVLSEGIERNQEVIQSSGLRAAPRNLRRGSRRALTQRWAEGDISMEVARTGFGRWFEHALGGTPTIAQPDAVGNPTVYLHTYSLGSLTGKALTVQKQLRTGDNTVVQQFTAHGGKVTDWTIGVGTGEIATFDVSLDFEDIDTTTAAGSPTYADTQVFHFAQASIYKAGTAIAKVDSASIEGANNLRTDAFFLGTGGLKGEPEPNDWPEVTGSLSAEFESVATFYDAFAADTSFELRLEFIGATISGTYNYFLKARLPDCRFTGGTPTVGGPDVVVTDVPFEAAYDGTNAGVIITYQTTDSAA